MTKKLAESLVNKINEKFLVNFLGNAPVGVYDKHNESKVIIRLIVKIFDFFLHLFSEKS